LRRRLRFFIPVLSVCLLAAIPAVPQEREPLEAYRLRRAALQEKLGDGVIVLFGATEAEGSEAYHVFRQESNFYYLTGYDDPGAALLLAPPLGDSRSPLAEKFSKLPHEELFLPPRDPEEEKWTGPEADPLDPAIGAQTGFESVKPIQQLASELRRYAKAYPAIYTLLPDVHAGDGGGAEKDNLSKLKTLFPFAQFRDARRAIGALRQIKSDGEVKLIERAIDCTMKGLQAAGSELRPGLFEYEAAALLKYTFERNGCLGLAFDPIVGAGHNSTVLHYTKSSARMESGDLVVMDVGAEYALYASDMTRTFPVNGRFTARQREIYEIVLGAQNAAIKAIKPGMRISGRGSDSLYTIAYNYINTHGKDSHGEPLGQYFIHGLGHHVGLDVHDAGDPGRVLEPGMVVTMEPGIYLPDENLGVRIEDMALVTKTGYILLTERLPREPDQIEKWMKK